MPSAGELLRETIAQHVRLTEDISHRAHSRVGREDARNTLLYAADSLSDVRKPWSRIPGPRRSRKYRQTPVALAPLVGLIANQVTYSGHSRSRMNRPKQVTHKSANPLNGCHLHQLPPPWTFNPPKKRGISGTSAAEASPNRGDAVDELVHLSRATAAKAAQRPGHIPKRVS